MGTKVFNEIPEIVDLMPSGGRAGFEYALIASQNIVKAQNEEWDSIDRISAFEIHGPMGKCPVILMGKGKSIYGPSSITSRPKAWIDPTICELTGLWLKGEEPAPKEPPKVVKTVVSAPA